jgi:anti-sigma factor RsiW
MSDTPPISEDDLHAYVDGVLVEPQRRTVDAYLAGNPAAADRVRTFTAQRAMLRDHFASILAEPIPAELTLVPIGKTRTGAGLSGWRAVAAACLLLGLGGSAGWYGRQATAPETAGIAALADEAAANFAVYVPDHMRPVEVRAEDGPTMTAWMSARLGRPVTAPDLAGSGYRLMGGRVVATPHGPAGMFMYDDDHGSRIVLLSRRMDKDTDAPVSERKTGDAATWSWAQNGIGYSLAKRWTPDPFGGLANEVRRQVGLGA